MPGVDPAPVPPGGDMGGIDGGDLNALGGDMGGMFELTSPVPPGGDVGGIDGGDLAPAPGSDMGGMPELTLHQRPAVTWEVCPRVIWRAMLSRHMQSDASGGDMGGFEPAPAPEPRLPQQVSMQFSLRNMATNGLMVLRINLVQLRCTCTCTGPWRRHGRHARW